VLRGASNTGRICGRRPVTFGGPASSDGASFRRRTQQGPRPRWWKRRPFRSDINFRLGGANGFWVAAAARSGRGRGTSCSRVTPRNDALQKGSSARSCASMPRCDGPQLAAFTWGRGNRAPSSNTRCRRRRHRGAGKDACRRRSPSPSVNPFDGSQCVAAGRLARTAGDGAGALGGLAELPSGARRLRKGTSDAAAGAASAVRLAQPVREEGCLGTGCSESPRS